MYPNVISDIEYGLSLKSERIGLITGIIDAEGNKRSLQYRPRLTELYNEISEVFSEYENPVVVASTDRRGTKTSFNYSLKPDGYSRDNFTDVISNVAVTGFTDNNTPFTIDYGLNGYGSAVEITDAAGTEYTDWDAKHLKPKSIIDRKGYLTSYTYDDHGNQNSITYQLDEREVTEIRE